MRHIERMKNRISVQTFSRLREDPPAAKHWMIGMRLMLHMTVSEDKTVREKENCTDIGVCPENLRSRILFSPAF